MVSTLKLALLFGVATFFGGLIIKWGDGAERHGFAPTPSPARTIHTTDGSMNGVDQAIQKKVWQRLNEKKKTK